MAWLEGCIGCHETRVTLRKIKDGPRICQKCMDKLARNKQLVLPDGSGKLVLIGGKQVTFMPAVKNKVENKEVEK